MAPETKRRKKRLRVDMGDEMPYVWPEGPPVGPVWGKRVWQGISVLLLFVLIAVLVFIASKSWPVGTP